MGSVIRLVQGGLECGFITQFFLFYAGKSFDYAAEITRICTTASCQMPCHGILEHRNLYLFQGRIP